MALPDGPAAVAIAKPRRVGRQACNAHSYVRGKLWYVKQTSLKLALSASVAALALAAAVSVSNLWGEHGELWEPGGRLPDFSYAPNPNTPKPKEPWRVFCSGWII